MTDDLKVAIAQVRKALAEAPPKQRIELQAYWDWYDQHRVTAVTALEYIAAALEDELEPEDAQDTKPPRKK